MMFTSNLTGAYYIILIVLVLSGIGLIPPSVAYIIFITLYMLYAGIQMNKDVIKKIILIMFLWKIHCLNPLIFINTYPYHF